VVGELSKEKKEEIIERVEDKARAYEWEYHGCGQSVLLALQEELHLVDPSSFGAAFKAAGFVAAGTARMGNMCGALNGGIMALGLLAGRERIEDPVYPNLEDIDEASGQPKSLELARKFYHRFIQEFGSWICRDIHISLFGRSFDLSIPADHEKFRHAGGYIKCSKLVGKAARIAGEIILEKLESDEAKQKS